MRNIDVTPNHIVVSKQNLTDKDIEWLFENGPLYGLKAVWNDDEYKVLYVVIFNHSVDVPPSVKKYVDMALENDCKFLGFADEVPLDYVKVTKNI